MTKSSCSHPSLFYFESKWICHCENMTPTVATAPKQGEIMIACKECISPDWNMMSHCRLSKAGMTLDQMMSGRGIRNANVSTAQLQQHSASEHSTEAELSSVECSGKTVKARESLGLGV